ncbi:MAG: hypothetical protein R3C68_16995 [Myxococcota bacterium]
MLTILLGVAGVYHPATGGRCNYRRTDIVSDGWNYAGFRISTSGTAATTASMFVRL